MCHLIFRHFAKNVGLYSFSLFVSLVLCGYLMLPDDMEIVQVFIDKIPNINVIENFKLSKSKPKIIRKVHEMNVKLKELRIFLLRFSNMSDPIVSLSALPVTRLYEEDRNYYDQIKNFSCVTTLNLTWDKQDDQSPSLARKVMNIYSNNLETSVDFGDTGQWLLHDKYYRFTASQPLCDWITKENARLYGYLYNFTCNTQINKGSTSTMFEPLYFNARRPSNNDIKPHQPHQPLQPHQPHQPHQPLHRFKLPTTYHVMQIFTRSIVSSIGEPFCDELQVKPYDCPFESSSQPNAAAISKLPFYEEVFVITQGWAFGFYHKMIENVPRAALFLEFLIQHPTIKILAYDRLDKIVEFVESLGLSRNRIITGWIRTNIAYVPKSTSCLIPNLIDVQFLQYHNSKFISDNLLKQTNETRNKLVLINRSGKRKFTDQKSIELLLNQTSAEYGFEFIIFRDDPSPSLNETMVIFSLASIIVAPHGAGLSNLVFSRPGTLVIEGVCQKEVLTLCFQRLAYALGMRWHGIPSLRGCLDVIDIQGDEIDIILRAYLRIIPIEELTTS